MLRDGLDREGHDRLDDALDGEVGARPDDPDEWQERIAAMDGEMA